VAAPDNPESPMKESIGVGITCHFFSRVSSMSRAAAKMFVWQSISGVAGTGLSAISSSMRCWSSVSVTRIGYLISGRIGCVQPLPCSTALGSCAPSRADQPELQQRHPQPG
jgi:hypothetical protein